MEGELGVKKVRPRKQVKIATTIISPAMRCTSSASHGVGTFLRFKTEDGRSTMEITLYVKANFVKEDNNRATERHYLKSISKQIITYYMTNRMDFSTKQMFTQHSDNKIKAEISA